MKAPINTHRQLLEALSKLSDPPPGHTRVYRGQTSDFGAMLPTGLRPGAAERDPIWHYCAIAVGRELSPGIGTAPDDDSLWIEAIAQHYGPGSRLLDVTRSIDIALWFALHERRPVPAEHIVGPPGRPDKEQDIRLKETWWEYSKSTTDGYVYIFDIPDWTGTGSPPHGALLDASSRPRLSKSSRIQVQEACLVAAAASINGGNLQEFYVCEPIRVSWPTDDAPRINDSTDLLFPDPSADPWYNFFLSIPLTWIVEPDSRILKLARPLEVASYLYSSEIKIEEIRRRTKFITPSPFYPTVESSLSMKPSEAGEFHVNEATRILLEAPLLHWFLSYGPEMWNQGILAEDLSDEVNAIVSKSQESRVSLKNVFMEFSPLENTDWGHLTDRTDYNVQPLRALWLVRSDSHFGLYLFPQQITIRDAKNYGAGPFLYTFNPDSRAFVRLDPGQTIGIEADWQTARDKAFWIALTVLRFLSPIPKSDPCPLRQSNLGDGTHVMTIPIRRAVARLMRVSEATNNRHWYVPRDVLTDKPFFPASEGSYVDVLQLDCATAWPQVDATYIRRLIRERFSEPT